MARQKCNSQHTISRSPCTRTRDHNPTWPWVATPELSWTRCQTRCSLKIYFHKLTVYKRSPTTSSWSTKWSRGTIELRGPSASYQSNRYSSKPRPPQWLEVPPTHSPAAILNSSKIKTNRATSPKILDSPSSLTRAIGLDSPGTQMDSRAHHSRGSSNRGQERSSRTTARAMMRSKHQRTKE